MPSCMSERLRFIIGWQLLLKSKKNGEMAGEKREETKISLTLFVIRMYIKKWNLVMNYTLNKFKSIFSCVTYLFNTIVLETDVSV